MHQSITQEISKVWSLVEEFLAEIFFDYLHVHIAETMCVIKKEFPECPVKFSFSCNSNTYFCKEFGQNSNFLLKSSYLFKIRKSLRNYEPQ